MSCNYFTERKCHDCWLFWGGRNRVFKFGYKGWVSPRRINPSIESYAPPAECARRATRDGQRRTGILRDVVNRSFVWSCQRGSPTHWLVPVWQRISGGAQRPRWSSAKWSQWKRLTVRLSQVASLKATNTSCCDLPLSHLTGGTKDNAFTHWGSILTLISLTRFPLKSHSFKPIHLAVWPFFVCFFLIIWQLLSGTTEKEKGHSRCSKTTFQFMYSLKTQQICRSFTLEWWDYILRLLECRWACSRFDRVISDTETRLVCQCDQRSVSFWATRLSREVGQQARERGTCQPARPQPAHPGWLNEEGACCCRRWPGARLAG